MMSRNSHFTEYIDTLALGQVILQTVCPFCGKKRKLVFNGAKADEYKKGRKAYEAGYHIQAAFPTFTASEREFILTGICDSCWDNMQ